MQAPVSRPAPIQPGEDPATARGLMLAIALIAAAGVVVSSVSLYHHFGTSKTSFCNFNESFNCDIVNRSSYSSVLGVPVALIGILGYLLILALTTVYRDKAETPVMLLIASYVEKFILQAWCVLCLSSLTLILATAVLSGFVLKTARDEEI